MALKKKTTEAATATLWKNFNKEMTQKERAEISLQANTAAVKQLRCFYHVWGMISGNFADHASVTASVSGTGSPEGTPISVSRDKGSPRTGNPFSLKEIFCAYG